MLKYYVTLFICSLLMASAFFAQGQNQLVDTKGNIVFMKAETLGLQMNTQCKSFRITRNPSLMPRLKCRFS